MKVTFRFRNVLLFSLSLVFMLAGCSKDALIEPVVEESNSDIVEFRNHPNRNFNASLKGQNEVPPADTDATGQAIIRISKDEMSIYYKIIASNLDDVSAAHLHMAPEGSNGPVVAGLYSNMDQPSGPQNGILAEGTLTSDDVMNITFEELVEAIRAGMIYVNVHSGDFPGGELRGQL